MLNYIFTARSRASVVHMRCIHHGDSGYWWTRSEGFSSSKQRQHGTIDALLPYRMSLVLSACLAVSQPVSRFADIRMHRKKNPNNKHKNKKNLTFMSHELKYDICSH